MSADVFKGVVPALMTPWTRDQQPDFGALVRKGRELIATGMSAVIYCGSMGEWPLLTDEQRMEGVEHLAKTGLPVPGYQARIVDTAGNIGTAASQAVTIDTAAPVVAIGNPGGATNQPSLILTGTVSGADAGTTIAIFDGATQIGVANISGGTWSTNVTLSNGAQVSPDRNVRAQLQKRLGVSDLFYPDNRLRSFSEREKISIITLAPELQQFAERNHVFLHGFDKNIGNGHWNVTGNEVAGELLAKKICEGALLK